MSGRMRSSVRGLICVKKCVKVGRCSLHASLYTDDITENVIAYRTTAWLVCECLWIKRVWVCLSHRHLSVQGRKSTQRRIVTLMRKQASGTTVTSSSTHTENTHSPPGAKTPPTGSFSTAVHPSFCGDKCVPLAWQGDKEQTGPDLRHKTQHENTPSLLHLWPRCLDGL